jgi:hypothetical protein
MTSHAIIALQEQIVSAIWNPKIDSLLAICCESGRFYIWKNEKQDSQRSTLSVVNIPAGECRVYMKLSRIFKTLTGICQRTRSIHSNIH